MVQARSLAIALLWLAGSLPAASLPPRYEVVVLPGFELGGVSLPSVIGRDLSNEGHVAGIAGNVFGQSVAFLYTVDGRLIGIDPPGTFISAGQLVNDLGQLLGESVSIALKDHFLFSEEEGSISLRDGLPKGSGQIFVTGFNNRGVVIAFAAKSRTPLVYTPGEGWRNARDLHPLLRDPDLDGELTLTSLNDSGDFLFQIGRGSVPDSRFQRIENFVVTRDGDFHRFGAKGNLILEASFPSESPLIVGSMVEREFPAMAFAWTPDRGVFRIGPPEATQSLAAWSPLRNVVAGGSNFEERAPGEGLDSLFVHSLKNRGPNYAIRGQRFRPLLRKVGLDEFLSVFAIAFNERREFVGDVTGDPGETRLPYLARRKKRPVSLQSIVDAAGVDFEVLEVVDLNRRGQILVLGRASGGRGTSALLTPHR